MIRKFWNFVTNDEGTRTLYLDGEISDETWWGDEITPQLFRDDLESGSGDIILWINSPGGDVFAATQIYNMLKEYEGKVTVRIDSLAASAASVIAMAGDMVYMAPTSILMIHNPIMMAIGDSGEMQKAIVVLDEVKESIMNAYQLKTGMRRSKISQLMDAETWMSAQKAIDLGFADGMLYDKTLDERTIQPEAMLFSRRACTASLLDKIRLGTSDPGSEKPKEADALPESGDGISDAGTDGSVPYIELKMRNIELLREVIR